MYVFLIILITKIGLDLLTVLAVHWFFFIDIELLFIEYTSCLTLKSTSIKVKFLYFLSINVYFNDYYNLHDRNNVIYVCFNWNLKKHQILVSFLFLFYHLCLAYQSIESPYMRNTDYNAWNIYVWTINFLIFFSAFDFFYLVLIVYIYFLCIINAQMKIGYSLLMS